MAEFVADGPDLDRFIVQNLAQGGVFVDLDTVQVEDDILTLEAMMLGPDFRSGEDYSDAVYRSVGVCIVLAEIDGIVGQAAGFFNCKVGGFVCV